MVKILLRYLGLLGLAASLTACGSLFYWPEKGLRGTPDQLGMSYESVELNTATGLRLHGWWFPASKQTSAQGMVYFLHGNAENISTHFLGVHWLTKHGWEIFILDYRGYGLSEGNPNIQGVHHDAYIGLKWALQRASNTDLPLVVLGQSAGAATALTLVAQATEEEKNQLIGLIADSAFSGYRRIAREKLASSWLTWPLQYPLSFTIADKHSPEYFMQQLPAGLPVLFLHSCADAIIPCSHSQRLYALSQQPKTYWQAEDAGHIQMLNQLKWRKELIEWLDNLRK